MKPTSESAKAVSSTAATRFLRLASGTPPRMMPKAMTPLAHGSRDPWFVAEDDAVMVSVTVPLVLAGSVTLLLESEAVISEELGDAFNCTVSE